MHVYSICQARVFTPSDNISISSPLNGCSQVEGCLEEHHELLRKQGHMLVLKIIFGRSLLSKELSYRLPGSRFMEKKC